MQTTLPLPVVLIELTGMFSPSEKGKGCKEESEFAPEFLWVRERLKSLSVLSAVGF